MIIHYVLSQQYADRLWVETGLRLKDLKRDVIIADEDLTPEQRKIAIDNAEDRKGSDPFKVILKSYKIGRSPNAIFGGGVASPIMQVAAFNHELTEQEALDAIAAMIQQRKDIQQEIREIEDRIRQEKAQNARREQEQRKQEREAKRAEEEAQQAAKLAAIKEREDWIMAHGSERLRLCHKQAYDCTRLYLVERAALEYPDFILDFNCTAVWRERSGPSLEALQRLGELQKRYPEVDVIEIVWLTTEASNEPGDGLPSFNMAGEAIIIRDSRYGSKPLVSKPQ